MDIRQPDNLKLYQRIHNPQNTASQKVLSKLGFEYIGDEFYKPTGLYHPSYKLKNVLKYSLSETSYRTKGKRYYDKSVERKTLVTVKNEVAINEYPFCDDLPLVCLGEIANMPEHGIFIGKSGKCYFGHHIWNFRELNENEI